MKVKKYFSYLLALILLLFVGCKLGSNAKVDLTTKLNQASSNNSYENKDNKDIKEDSPYYSLEDVSGYLIKYKRLPKNYLTKSEAKKRGWLPKEGNLWEVTDKGVIGGDYFGNFEGKLPKGTYKEADVNYEGGRRGSDRIIFDDKVNIYYTKDHYKSFERINP